MKVLSYSLFGDPSSFEFGFYLRGLIFNLRMSKILYPDFHVSVYVEFDIAVKYEDLLNNLRQFGLHQVSPIKKASRCEMMLWRMKPFFERGVDYVICRDLDSVSTYREALCTYEWLNSGLPYHAINDNAAHGGLMGGLVAFKSEDFKRDTGYTSFDHMIRGLDLRQHGSDQNFLNKSVLPKIKNKLFLHNLKGAGCQALVVKTEVPASGPVDRKLYESDFISRFIGSPGVIDFELIRFFNRFSPDQKWDNFEKKYSNIFYWRR